jgi:hypothetical protein
MSKNNVKLKYQGKVLNVMFKSTANLYVLDAERQGAYALENLCLLTTENNSRVMHKNLYNPCFLSNNCPSTLSSIHVKKLPVQYEVNTTNYNKEEYKKNSTKKGHGNNKHQEPVYKSSLSQARELQEYNDNMKSIQEYQELRRKPHTGRDTKILRCTIIAVEEDVASTKSILNTEEPVLRHVSWISTTAIRKKLSSTVVEARIREEIKRRKLGKYMDINEAHYRMGHLGETALRSILSYHGI